MNHITIAGHLAADPEVRFTSSGKKVTSIRVATRTRKKGQEDTIWWSVSVWGEQFDKMIAYLKKGSPIFVVGVLDKPEIFTSQKGESYVSMNITAYHLSFSPFGKPDASKHENAETSIGSQESFAGPASGFAAPAFAAEADEVPF